MKIIGIALILTFSISLFGQRNVTGLYSSKKAELGFFVTRIQLNKDSTFKYEFSGDLAYNKGRGTYRLEKNGIIHLVFDEVKLDSAHRIYEALSGGSGAANQPMKFLFKNGKLYYFNLITGEVVKENYLERRKGKLIFRGE